MPKGSTLTSKGQVTIPIEVRRALGLKPHDRVEFHLEGDEVRIRKSRSKLRDIAGSIPPLKSGRTVDQAIQDARRKRAARRP